MFFVIVFLVIEKLKWCLARALLCRYLSSDKSEALLASRGRGGAKAEAEAQAESQQKASAVKCG